MPGLRWRVRPGDRRAHGLDRTPGPGRAGSKASPGSGAAGGGRLARGPWRADDRPLNSRAGCHGPHAGSPIGRQRGLMHPGPAAEPPRNLSRWPQARVERPVGGVRWRGLTGTGPRLCPQACGQLASPASAERRARSAAGPPRGLLGWKLRPGRLPLLPQGVKTRGPGHFETLAFRDLGSVGPEHAEAALLDPERPDPVAPATRSMRLVEPGC